MFTSERTKACSDGKQINGVRKQGTYLNLAADFLGYTHFIGEVEVAAAASATRFRNEGRSGRRQWALAFLSSCKQSAQFSQCGLSLFC